MKNMSVMTVTAEQQSCYYEERFSRLEQDVAKLNARMDIKKEDIHDINEVIAQDRQQQIELIEKVTEVTVLLKASQEQRKANDKKFDDIEDKIDQLQTEITETKEQLTDLVASQRSFRNVVIVGVPIIIGIIGLIFHFI